jgi:hypothetical protein
MDHVVGRDPLDEIRELVSSGEVGRDEMVSRPCLRRAATKHDHVVFGARRPIGASLERIENVSSHKARRSRYQPDCHALLRQDLLFGDVSHSPLERAQGRPENGFGR